MGFLGSRPPRKGKWDSMGAWIKTVAIECIFERAGWWGSSLLEGMVVKDHTFGEQAEDD